MTKMNQNWPKMSKKDSKYVKNEQKTSKIEFLYGGFSQYHRLFPKPKQKYVMQQALKSIESVG